MRRDGEEFSGKGLPVVKAAYSFLRDENFPLFHFTGWNNNRIVCHQTQLKRLLSAIPDQFPGESVKGFVSITNSSFPLPGTRIYTSEIDNDEQSATEEATDSETEAELMAAIA